MSDITKVKDQAAAWERNLEGLQNGVFGEIATYDEATTNQTMLRYWQEQERAGYPYASENVKYFEEQVRKNTTKGGSKTNKADRVEQIARDLNHIIQFKDNGFVARYATAEAFYDMGYRKASDVVGDIFKDINHALLMTFEYYASFGSQECSSLIETVHRMLGAIEKKYICE